MSQFLVHTVVVVVVVVVVDDELGYCDPFCRGFPRSTEFLLVGKSDEITCLLAKEIEIPPDSKGRRPLQLLGITRCVDQSAGKYVSF